MSTVTLLEAAQRLGVTPRQVRRFVSQHKLRVRREPTTAPHHGRRHVLLDADEVDTLAQVRAYKRQQRAAAAPDQQASPSLAATTAQALHRVEKARAAQERAAAQVARLREKLTTAEQKLARRVARLAALQEGPAESGGVPVPSAPGAPSAADPAATPHVYCVTCKGTRPLETRTPVVLKNGRRALQGPCAVCGTTLTCLRLGAGGATERA